MKRDFGRGIVPPTSSFHRVSSITSRAYGTDLRSVNARRRRSRWISFHRRARSRQRVSSLALIVPALSFRRGPRSHAMILPEGSQLRTVAPVLLTKSLRNGSSVLQGTVVASL